MLTDEENEDAARLLKGASKMAQKYGPMIYDESEGVRQSITAMAIMISSLAIVSGVSMHSLMGVIMEVYKKTQELGEQQ